MKLRFFMFIFAIAVTQSVSAVITNVYGRDYQMLNGLWDVIVDQYDQGARMKIYENKSPKGLTDFYEYSFDGGERLHVPGDWNSQSQELKRYEGTVWYGRHLKHEARPSERKILYFNGVNYRCKVYLNGKKITEHEGGFTPFEVDVTDSLKDGDNFLVVEVNNTRTPQSIPAMAFDWWNYGGITRDVMLVTVPDNYIQDYFIRLAPESSDIIDIDVKMSDASAGVDVKVTIPELNQRFEGVTDANGMVKGRLKAKKLQRWDFENPKLYDVVIETDADRVTEEIGFRNIAVRGNDILLNGKPQFMRSVSFHEEIPQRQGRAFSHNDAVMLINEAKELGVNMVRLAHYPQNEYIVREAEKNGILLWEEIPVWQGIDFVDCPTLEKAKTMLAEMIGRDKNRCAIGFWSVANETKPSEARNAFLKELLKTGRALDDTRLYTAAFDLVEFDKEKGIFVMDDDFTDNLDVVGVNKYLGWYHEWPLSPEKATWDVVSSKPLIITEFGGEALYGREGSRDVVSSWSEDYQARLYEDNLKMFQNIPNLAGVSPWVLYDFRSPFRFHPVNQEGWNRKGLVSDKGQRKKAWYIMKEYYEKKKNEYADKK